MTAVEVIVDELVIDVSLGVVDVVVVVGVVVVVT